MLNININKVLISTLSLTAMLPTVLTAGAGNIYGSISAYSKATHNDQVKKNIMMLETIFLTSLSLIFLVSWIAFNKSEKFIKDERCNEIEKIPLSSQGKLISCKKGETDEQKIERLELLKGDIFRDLKVLRMDHEYDEELILGLRKSNDILEGKDLSSEKQLNNKERFSYYRKFDEVDEKSNEKENPRNAQGLLISYRKNTETTKQKIQRLTGDIQTYQNETKNLNDLHKIALDDILKLRKLNISLQNEVRKNFGFKK